MKSWPGRGATADGGYTITEVMIVLAVTTLMFTVVAASMYGRQAKAEFTRGVRDMEGNIETLISEVSNGGYTPTNCAIVSGSPQLSGGAVTTTGQCIYLGKLVRNRNYNNTALPWDASESFGVVGRRYTESGGVKYDVTTLADAAPVVSSTLQDSYEHIYQVAITKIVTIDDAERLYGYGFIQPLAGTGSLQGDQSVGSKGVSLYGLHNQPNITTDGTHVDIVNWQRELAGIRICIKGRNDQFGEIRIGENGTDSFLTTWLDQSRPVAGEPCYV